MAYDQGYYNQPQRPYNGQADRRPGPPQQGYNQPAQRHPPQQQYDQYGQDDYGYDGYGQDYDQGYGDYNGGGGGRGNGYPPQERGHPQQQQQDYYNGGQRGGMPAPRGGRGGPAPRPPTDDGGMRGGYDQRGVGGRGYPNGGPAGPGRGGRPAPLERAPSSDPGMRGQGQVPRKPLKTPPLSPEVIPAWDNPFPTFPGAKKKTSVSEEQEILQKMAAMDIGQPNSRPRTAGSKGSGGRGASIDDYARPSIDSQRRIAPPEDYGRSPLEQRNQNMPPRNYPPQAAAQQGYQEPRRGPPGPGFGPPPRQNTYAGDQGYNDGSYGQGPASPMRENFGPPARSMTMPNEPPMHMGRKPPMTMIDDIGQSAPYNGPVGRGMPPRPNTATGNRPPPQRTHPADPYANGGGQDSQSQHARGGSVSDLYDDYYGGGGDAPLERRSTNESQMPDFDAMSVSSKPQRRGNSIDGHIPPPQQNGYGQPVTKQADARSQIQPSSATFEMAGDAPPMPNGYDRGYQDEYRNDSYNQAPGRGPPGQDYYQPPRTNGFQPPPRTASAGPAFNGRGLPPGPSPNGMPRQPPPEGGLPSHPPPVRAGLIPNSVAAQANNKPPPVRSYNNISPAQQTIPSTASSSAPSSVPAAATPTPVTEGELNQLRNTVKINPNDQASQMLLARRLVEASETLVSAIPDQRARSKARERYIMDAHKLLKKLVAGQNSEAMFYLADCYGRGALGLESDNKEAFSLYQSAAKAGHAAAAYRTAVCCELGNEEGGGTRKDPMKAIQWYKRAAMLGDTPAMYKMGIVQLKGLLGQPKNPREAVGWLKRAADRADAENPHALHELALLYEQPQSADSSVVRDENYSFELFKQAADLGYKFSQFRLGCAYEYGLFACPIDPRQSIMWYSRAAAQEEHQSELALSGWYLTGSEGVLQQSDTEAYLWARKAAMAGLAKAEYAMGYFTEVGIGSPAEIEGAKRWYWRAAAQNFPKARERLEDLKRGGAKASLKPRERISRSKVGKQNEGECVLM